MTQPEIRFKGFSDEWNIVKLKDVVIESVDKSVTENQYDVLSSTVAGVELRKGRVSGKSNIGYKVLDLNHLVLSPQNLWLGNINVNRLVKGIVSPSYKVYAFNSDKLLSAYASYVLRTERLLNEYEDVSVQGASTVRRSLDLNRFYDIKCELPSLPEQQKIGALFSKYDAIIALYEQKLEELNALKKGLLQQMFPKNGAKVPELRFEGFVEDWSECKLGDILSERNDQVPETNEYPLMSFVQDKGVTPKGERYNRSFLVKDSEKKYKKTELGDFIYSSNNLETGSIGVNKTGKAVISPVYSIFKSENSQTSQFIGIMSARKDFISKMVRFRQGVVYGQWRIHESDFLNIDVQMPNDKEQQLIISFFKNIDDTISLHQRKVDWLKEQKKGLLERVM